MGTLLKCALNLSPRLDSGTATGGAADAPGPTRAVVCKIGQYSGGSVMVVLGKGRGRQGLSGRYVRAMRRAMRGRGRGEAGARQGLNSEQRTGRLG